MQPMKTFQIRKKITLTHLVNYMVMVSVYSNETEYIFIVQLDTPQAESRPSEYLRERCPLCFGGLSWQQPEDMLV
jgi:hypothetical protein